MWLARSEEVEEDEMREMIGEEDCVAVGCKGSPPEIVSRFIGALPE